MHYAPQMTMVLESKKSCVAREYLKVATLRGASSEFIAFLSVFRELIAVSAQFRIFYSNRRCLLDLRAFASSFAFITLVSL
jgi:hypothetical protein